MYNSSQKGIPYITRASNFNNENLIVNRWTQTPVTVSEEGDLLITCKGTIGTMAFNNIGSIHIARQIMAIHSKDVDLHYLKLYFELNIGTLESQANSMIPGISREVVLNSLVPIPPLQEQIKTEKQKLVKEGKLKKSALNDSVIFRGDNNKYCPHHGNNTSA